MGELGKTENELHREVGEYAGGTSIDRFITVGPLAKHIAEGIRAVKGDADVTSFDQVDDLLPKLPELVKAGDTVLVKASHFMNFGSIVEALTEEKKA